MNCPKDFTEFRQYILDHEEKIHRRFLDHLETAGPCPDSTCYWPAYYDDISDEGLAAVTKFMFRLSPEMEGDAKKIEATFSDVLFHLVQERRKREKAFDFEEAAA